MASEATGIKTGMAIQVNMHMDIRVKEVARFKSKVIFIVSLLASLKGHCPLVGHPSPSQYVRIWD